MAADVDLPNQAEESPEPLPLSEAERGAMRAYIQRCEVRLSTLHRVATAFIGGAGLLLLIPVFFKDAFDSLLSVILTQISYPFAGFGTVGVVLTGVMYLCLFYPLFLSMAIPLYGVYLLLKDIIHFYFTIYTPGFPEDLLNPTFALTGVTLPLDEAPVAKAEVMRYQYNATQMGFMIPFSKERSGLYFDTIIESTKGNIIPKTRRIEALERLGVLPENYDPANVNRFNAALGLARSLDRTLTEEVAMTEMSLVRHVLYLRRLVLRYVKTLLMFIWTTVVAFMLLPFLKDGRFPPFVLLGAGYAVWALAVMWILDFPLYWLYRHRHSERPDEQVDPQLNLMQDRLQRYCKLAIASAVIGLMLAILSLLTH